MVRHRTRKTDREMTPADVMMAAVKAVVRDKRSLRKVSEEFNIKKSTLARYVIKSKDVDWEDESQVEKISFKPNYAWKQVFNELEEKNLSDYLTKAAGLHHGLPPVEARKLAYEYGKLLNKDLPTSWETNKAAGEDWLQQFMKRAGNISIRKPEATSLARSMGFNKPVVQRFYDQLFGVMEKYKFTAENIYNLDETGVTTVQTPGKVIAPKGAKQVGQLTSAERGELVTLCCTVNALGNTIPPYFVFPRKRFIESMLVGAPPSSQGTASDSGWMTTDIFFLVMEHFIKHSGATKEKKVLLLMDNHESHISIKTINLAKENGVILLTIPPHCSHKLQVLDKTVFGPFKTFFNDASRAWLVNHPGKRITIHQVAELAGVAYKNAFTMNNITSGFRSTGIYPFNRHCYTDTDFLAASVTDLPLEGQNQTVTVYHEDQTSEQLDQPSTSSFDQPSTSGNLSSPSNIELPSTIQDVPGDRGIYISPEHARPLPKVHEVKEKNKRGRKSMKSEVLTDTPVKLRLENEAQERAEKKKKGKSKEEVPKKIIKKKCVKKIGLLYEEKTSDEEEEWAESSSDDELVLEEIEDEPAVENEQIEVGDFIMIKLCGKTKSALSYYIAEVTNKLASGYEVKYMRRNPPRTGKQFVFDTSGIYFALDTDIERKLPRPNTFGGTERTLAQLTFPVNLDMYGSKLN